MTKSKLLVVLGILASLAGCGDSDSITVHASRGDVRNKVIGGLRVDHKGIAYFDYGFDGTLDKIYYIDGKGDKITITSSSPKFSEYERVYQTLRERVTRGE